MTRHNLPSRLTSFVGREREITEVTALLGTHRLVTLVGAPGVGKTRLGLEVARSTHSVFPDGVWLVELAPLADPGHVPNAVASALGVREQPGRELAATLAEYLRSRRMLLVLDNCEHLVASAATLAERLLRACPALHVLATSREPLAIEGEETWRVPSLTLPTAEQVHRAQHEGMAALDASEAVRLFVVRAHAAARSFDLTDQNVSAVVEICTRLDGIPLALELAAVRVQALSVQEIAARLDDRFRLLTGGSRLALPRQQTLRGTVAWSYELLTEPEQALLRRLAVFAGGWTLEAAERVCAGEGLAADEILDTLVLLVHKSLVQAEQDDAGGTRYRLLETIREYALERLQESGEAPALRRRHAVHFLSLSEEADPHLLRAEAGTWLDRLQAEHDNLRAALTWSAAAVDAADFLPPLAGHLWMFWRLRSHWGEARRWLDRALSLAAAPAIRFRVLTGAGNLALLQDDVRRSEALWSEAVALGRASHNESALARALGRLGHVVSEIGQHERARVLCREGLDLSRRLGDEEAIANALMMVGHAACNRRDNDEATAAWEECLRLDRASGISLREPDCLHLLGIIAIRRRELDLATTLCEKSLDLFRRIGDPMGVAMNLSRVGRIAQLNGDPERVAALAPESLTLIRQLGIRMHLVSALDRLAWVARARGDPERSTRILGAVEVLRGRLSRRDSSVEPGEHEAELATLRVALGNRAFESAWAVGRAMTLEQAYELAIETASMPTADAGSADVADRQHDGEAGRLTRREQQIAVLVADGLSNPQIADRLGLSDRTVDAHLRNIMGKLEVSSRAQVAAWSARHQLAEH